MTAGSATIIKKYKAIGKPAKVPNPFTVPAITPTKNLDELWFKFWFWYPQSNKIAKQRTVKEIIMWVIFGFKTDSNFIPIGVPNKTPKSK